MDTIEVNGKKYQIPSEAALEEKAKIRRHERLERIRAMRWLSKIGQRLTEEKEDVYDGQ